MSEAVILGASTSRTRTVWFAEALLPDPSFAVQVTVVSPTGNGAESSRLSLRVGVIDTSPQLSKADALPATSTAEPLSGSLTASIPAGAVTEGFSASVTVTS